MPKKAKPVRVIDKCEITEIRVTSDGSAFPSLHNVESHVEEAVPCKRAGLWHVPGTRCTCAELTEE